MIDNLTKEQRRVLLMWIIFGVVLMGILILLAGMKIKQSKYVQKADKVYQTVSDYSRYYTIISVLDKYYNKVNDKKYDDLYLLINDDYKKKNNITKDNIKDKIIFYDSSVTFKGKLMCSKKLGKGYTSYYVSGDVIGVNNTNVYNESYYDVLLNENDMTFSISIIDASTFGGACHV